MNGFLTVFAKIAMVLGVILVGWIARRRGALRAETTSEISRFIVDYAMPALIFSHMLRTVDAGMLKESWYYPLLGIGIIVVGFLLGLATLALVRERSTRRTFILVIGMCNWFYFPLVMVEALFEGALADRMVATILLFNLGIMPFVWSVGVWILRGGTLDRKLLIEHLLVPGFIATVLGLVVPIAFPAAATLHDVDPTTAGPVLLTGHIVITALTLLGTIALPLTLVMIGSQLGGLRLSSALPTLSTATATGLRLAGVPLTVYGLLLLVGQAGIELPAGLPFVLVLVASMPVAVNAPMLCERYGGNTDFAAPVVAYSTILSVLTVPAILYWTVGV